MTKPIIKFDANWKQTYKSQVMSATEAVKHISPGQRVFVGTACGEPLELVTALSKRAFELPDTEIVHLLTFGDAPYAHRELAQYFRVNSFFIAENVRYGGSRWEMRFRNALKLANTVTYATEERYLGHGMLYRFANQ